MNRNIIAQISRWLVTAFLIASFLVFSLQGASAEQSSAPASFQLEVDTQSDFNDLAHQACTGLPDDCSLRGAIQKANADPSRVYQVILPAGTYLLSLAGAGEDANATGDLDVHTSLQLVGAGAASTAIVAQGIDRVFHIFSGASLNIQGVTIQGGKTMDGAAGTPGGDSEDAGGIYNTGVLILKDCIIRDNQTGPGGPGGPGVGHDSDGGRSGNGGGIYNTGWLTLDHTDLIGNFTGGGGGGGSGDPPFWPNSCGDGGRSGDGGGIYNTGYLWLKDSLLTSNNVHSGGDGGLWVLGPYDGLCPGGQGGSGGGVYNTGHMQVERTVLTWNWAGGGGIWGAGGGGGAIYSSLWLEMNSSQVNANFAGNGWGGGGGIYNTGQLDMDNSQVTGNASGDGNSAGGQGGSGGGIYSNGQAVISNSLVDGNHTGGGGNGYCCYKYGEKNPPGGGGWGGGIFNAGRLSLDSTPIRGNTTGSGGSYDHGICCAVGGYGGGGGGLFNKGYAELWSSPVVGNTAGSGGDSVSGDGGVGGSGGGICNSGSLSLAYSPVMSNTAGMGGEASTSYVGGAGGSGGGISNSSNLSLAYSPVMSNTAGGGGAPGGPGGSGGGIVNTGGMDLQGGVVNRNKSGPGGSPDNQGGNGGGIDSRQGNFQLTNAILTENFVEPGGKGSGLYLGNTATLIHTTFARNAGSDGSGIYFTGQSLTLTNTILVSQTVGITTSGGNVNLDSTLWGTGAWANISDWGGSGTFTSTHDYYGDPAFTDPSNGDYHILPSSPAIDQGVWTGTTVDIDNQPRPNPSTNLPDLGADEYWLFIPIQQVSISGRSTITATQEVTFTATISPLEATPYIVYNWDPDPTKGQGTGVVTYVWQIPGTYTVTVTAWNASSSATVSQPVIVIFGPHPMFLPLVMWKGLMSP